MNLRILGTLVILTLTFNLNGQVEYLRLSPTQTITQRVGATNIELVFSRPQMKGRTIFGSLVPFDKMWRTGANENTKISFSHRVKIGETEVPEGTYSLFTKPSKQAWEIYLYTELDKLDVPNPIDSSKLIYLTTVDAYELERAEETLVINIYDITETEANLGISWENTAVKVPISFYTREAMEKMINKELKQNILDYSITAAYYSQRNIELQKAKKLQEISMELRDEPSAWAYNSYGIILHKLGELASAKAAIEYSLKLAEEAKNDYLIKENQRLLQALKEQ